MSKFVDGENILDYARGSGIWVIVELKLGAWETDGVDIDAQAMISSRQNEEKNSVFFFFTFHPGVYLVNGSGEQLKA